MIQPKTLKGFRDFLPAEARKRQYVLNTLKMVFELYGFEPLETPALEYDEILSGKYGEEGEKLMYRFADNGGRKVALRYDQTVPLARVVAQYQNDLPMPFKRYQIQPVWRAENTQKGRFREFLQVDADTVGTESKIADAELITIAESGLRALGFQKFKIFINDRNVFSLLTEKGLVRESQLSAVLRAIDKLDKVGRDGVLAELGKLGFEENRAVEIFNTLENQLPPENFMQVFENLKRMGIDNSVYEFRPTLARGLDYYTSTIFEVRIDGYDAGSVAGGGRYDGLIGMFSGRQISAVGFSFGFDRIMEAMDTSGLFPNDLTTTKVLVTVFNQQLLNRSFEIASQLRSRNINSELYLDPLAKLEKQMKYADKKGVEYVVVIGPDEAKNDTVTLKNLKTRTQEVINQDDLSQKLK